MTMLDDQAFLLFHTKTAFITSDETGACEIVVENEDNFTKVELSTSFLKKERPLHSADSELPHSPDIFPDMDYSGHRFRSNTAQRLEKLLIEKQNQGKIKRITWKQMEKSDDVNYAEIFEEKEVLPISERPPTRSLLSQQIEEFNKIQAGNSFCKYAKFDGRPLYGINNSLIKKIDIFLTMAPPTERGHVMSVVTVLNAKIRDFIGLICWQYSIEKREPKLKQDANLYDLYMAEDNGEADRDFPPLDPREPVTKFDFARLALVEKNVSPSHSEATNRVPERISWPTSKSSDLLEKFNIKSSISIHIPGSGVVILSTKDPGKGYKNIADILIEVVTKEKLDAKYHLEHLDRPGLVLDNDLLLEDLDTNDLCLIKNSSSSNSFVATYTIHMLQKFRPSVEVYMVISDKRFEIHLPKQPVPFSLKQMKQVFNAESLIRCQRIEDKHSSTGNAQMFRISVKVSSNKVKQKSFVCDAGVADEIISRLNRLVLDRRDLKPTLQKLS